MKRAYLLWITAVLSLIAAPTWMANRGETQPPSTTTAQAEATDEMTKIQGIGFVEPVGEIRKLVLKVNGVIAKCPADIGRRYKKGDMLAELDNREQLANIAVGESDWKLAKAERDKILCGVNPFKIVAAEHRVETLREQVRYWQKEHERAKSLSARNTLSSSEYDRTLTEWTQKRLELQEAEADLNDLRHFVREEDRAMAEAKVNAAKARLDLARQQYEDTILRAPFDGTVLEILKREGEGSRLFDPEPVIVFGDLSRLRVRAEVDERFVANLQAGQPAIVFGRGLGKKQYKGRVNSIKLIMGKKTVFSRSASERKDLDVVQVLIDLEPHFQAPTGLQIDVTIVNEDPLE